MVGTLDFKLGILENQGRILNREVILLAYVFEISLCTVGEQVWKGGGGDS